MFYSYRTDDQTCCSHSRIRNGRKHLMQWCTIVGLFRRIDRPLRASAQPVAFRQAHRIARSGAPILFVVLETTRGTDTSDTGSCKLSRARYDFRRRQCWSRVMHRHWPIVSVRRNIAVLMTSTVVRCLSSVFDDINWRHRMIPSIAAPGSEDYHSCVRSVCFRWQAGDEVVEPVNA